MNTQPLNSITSKELQNLKNTKIFVAGDVILDAYIEGNVSRISPEAPAPILLETKKHYVPGGAGNVAANIAHFGAFVQICGRIGDDIEANILINALQKFGVHTDTLIREDCIPTTTKTRIISHHEFSLNAHQLVRMDRELTETIQKSTHHACIEAYKNFLIDNKKSSALILSDYGKGFLTPSLIQDLIQISNKYDIPVIVDPKSSDIFRYKNATVIKPNLSEGRVLYKQHHTSVEFASFEDESSAIAQYYLKQSACKNIVMSLSQHGIIALGDDFTEQLNNSDTLRFPTKALQVADVSGAGDTLTAFLTMSLAAELSFIEAVHLGNIAAGIVCGKPGTSVVNTDELFESIHKPSEKTYDEKIIGLNELIPVITDLQNKNQKIVFSNGCFDILHAGHVDYLQKAKEFGDLLVIGLNSDSSVKQLKGEGRPIQTASDRAKILSALACTDFIVEFNEQTPIELILELKPDVLVKGADYNFETTVGSTEVSSWGGKVVHIDLLPNRSTTSILDRL